jgi:hypothetical protein
VQTLEAELDKLIAQLSKEEESKLKTKLDNLMSVYPFNHYEFIISTLLGLKKLNLEDYYLIRDEYIARNMYLHIFEISAPRGFGELWAQGHLKELVPDLVKPTKKIDPAYEGQYDFLLPIDDKKFLTLEVKASRAVDFISKEPLYIKALSQNADRPFDMNFQQIKPKCCDVFVWIGVWRDVIKYWVLSSNEVANNKYYSTGQHRGNVGEGQLHVNRENIKVFENYLTPSDKLKEVIIAAYLRQVTPEKK